MTSQCRYNKPNSVIRTHVNLLQPGNKRPSVQHFEVRIRRAWALPAIEVGVEKNPVPSNNWSKTTYITYVTFVQFISYLCRTIAEKLKEHLHDHNSEQH